MKLESVSVGLVGHKKTTEENFKRFEMMIEEQAEKPAKEYDAAFQKMNDARTGKKSCTSNWFMHVVFPVMASPLWGSQ